MGAIRINGPTLVFEFAGNVRDKAKGLPYVAAAWCDLSSTRVAVKCSRNPDAAYLALCLMMLESAIGQEAAGDVHFSDVGCDVVSASPTN
jgi:hypothetical protein